MLEMLLSLKGRINRKPYLLFVLVVSVGFVISTAIDVSTADNPLTARAILHEKERGLVSTLFLCLSFWPGLAMQVKRWHDIDKSGWWVLINCIPIIGSLWALLETGLEPGTEGRNRYGNSPLKEDIR